MRKLKFLASYVTCYAKGLVKNEKGQAMVEYGLIIALVSVALIVVLGLLALALFGVFDGAADALDGAAGS